MYGQNIDALNKFIYLGITQKLREAGIRKNSLVAAHYNRAFVTVNNCISTTQHIKVKTLKIYTKFCMNPGSCMILKCWG